MPEDLGSRYKKPSFQPYAMAMYQLEKSENLNLVKILFELRQTHMGGGTRVNRVKLDGIYVRYHIDFALREINGRRQKSEKHSCREKKLKYQLQTISHFHFPCVLIKRKYCMYISLTLPPPSSHVNSYRTSVRNNFLYANFS